MVHNIETNWMKSMRRECDTPFARDADSNLESEETWWNRYPGW